MKCGLFREEEIEPQIPHRLKSVRDDKSKRVVTAHPFGKLRAWLKLRPFKTTRTLVSARLKACPFKAQRRQIYLVRVA